MVVYVTDGERAPLAAEQAYWRTAASLMSAYLARRADENRAVTTPRTGSRPNVTPSETSDS
jgi:hypothetical protein